MSNPRERVADDAYEAKNDAYPNDPNDTNAGVPNEGMNQLSGREANSDAQLARDESEAIDEGKSFSKGVSGGTRGATKPKGTYTEPGDEEGLPGRGETGSSSVRTGGY